ncbi:MAG: hypothetical protein SynsKO_39600 [Synoicihabitans sp.]
MNALPKIIGAAALIATFASPLLFANDTISETAMKSVMLIAMVAWFAVAPKIMSPR